MLVVLLLFVAISSIKAEFMTHFKLKGDLYCNDDVVPFAVVQLVEKFEFQRDRILKEVRADYGGFFQLITTQLEEVPQAYIAFAHNCTVAKDPPDSFTRYKTWSGIPHANHFQMKLERKHMRMNDDVRYPPSIEPPFVDLSIDLGWTVY